MTVAPSAPAAAAPPPVPADFDDPVLPLTPELRALLDAGGEENWRLFCRGRRAQIDAALRAVGHPGLPPRAAGTAG